MPTPTTSNIIEGLQQPELYMSPTAGTVVALRPETAWNLGGSSPAGSYDTTLNGVTLTSPTTGQIHFDDPSSGKIAYLARTQLMTQTVGTIMIADRLWHNGGIDVTSTSPQSITSPTWPARDVDGTTNGKGVFLALEVSSTVGSATPTITIEYTNSGGTGTRTGTNILDTVASAATGATYFISLQAGDLGVRSVQSITLSASWVSGTINLVALRPIALIPCKYPTDFADVEDAITLGLPKLYNGSVPYFTFIPSGNGSLILLGSLQWSHI